MVSQIKKRIFSRKWLSAFFALFTLVFSGVAASAQHPGNPLEPVKKVLFIGDSMTGWMAERLNAYGDANDFEVATIVWDGSTLSKWSDTPDLKEIIAEQNPDAIIVSLGMNEMFERKPDRFKPELDTIVEAFGNVPFLWIGPPSWPGHSEGKIFNDWLAENLGEGNYYSSLNLQLPRQSKNNPHPTKKGIEEWIDDVVVWVPEHSKINLPVDNKPAAGKMTRGKTFIYKRMNDKL